MRSAGHLRNEACPARSRRPSCLLGLLALLASGGGCAHAIHVYIGGDHQHAERVERECRMKNAECRIPQSRPAQVGE